MSENSHSSSTPQHCQNEVFFVSTPAIGMLTPTVEFARRLVRHSGDGLSATVLLIPVPHWPTIHSYTQSLPATSSPNLRFHLLPPATHPPSPDHSRTYAAHVSALVEAHKPGVKCAVSGTRRRVAGLFVDMFCTPVIDVADELGVPSYLFFASPAGFLSLMLGLRGDLGTRLASDSAAGAEFGVPGFANPVPSRVLPTTVLERGDGYSWYLRHANRYALTKGIVVNTLQELEPLVLDSLSVGGLPRVYPIGPVLDLVGPAQWHPDRAQHERVVTWLDKQPESSVVFLCFGSMGSLSGPQVREIALGLKRAGFRFVWSCRDPPKTRLGLPGEYPSFDDVLPDGFLDDTSQTGLVCGWVPQVSILAHRAIGGFVSHCGWNSVLESLWHGVPIATWPIYAEQQLNAFEMVKELGLAVEITLDYREGSDLVRAEEVEKGIKRLMEDGGGVRTNVKGMSGKLKMALMENGSSYVSLSALVEQLNQAI